MATINDKAILDCIINPLCSSEEFVLTDVNESITEYPKLNINFEHIQKIKKYEMEGVILAEGGNFEAALEMFNKAVLTAPSWPSAYNNRAQTLRLLGRNEDAMNDLNMAIDLSHGQGKAACQAFCQRAMLHQLENKEEESIKDWESAAKLGNRFAKNELVKRNPYAALCNKMLHDVFKQLKQGEYADLKK